MRRCSRCHEAKDESEFHRDVTQAHGLSSQCKVCRREVARDRYAASPLALARRREVRARLKREVIAAYGGECACCGEGTYEFLTVDHVGGWGAEHRRVVGEGTGNIYRWLKNNGFPKGIFQLLCWNCNCAMGVHGYCPHGVVVRRGEIE